LIQRQGGSFENSRCYKGLYRAGNLSDDIFLDVPAPGDDKNLAGLASFDFRML